VLPDIGFDTGSKRGPNPFRVGGIWGLVTQGSSCRATLGFETVSFQDMKQVCGAEGYRWDIKEKIQQEETEGTERE
jgi:hypothetical protein